MKDFVLKLTRKVVENFVKTGKKVAIPKKYPEEMKKKRGVFVTLHKKGMLRGCIGLPYPQKPLIEGLIDAACSACQDPRFNPLEEDELEDIKIDVSVLTEPELIKTKPENYSKEIEIGKHGLIIRSGMFSGLFLPQVPVEQGWKLEEYLENLCHKAGLPGRAWQDPEARLFKFETEAFSEGI
ncbi:MAG: TIGR00296 family protein [Candidatus Aenigmatarchaeota archaeon]